MLCYCKQEIEAGARQIIATVTVDWGADDLRETLPAKTGTFHSFACLEQWAHDRALAHDGVVVTEGDADAA